MTIPDASGHDRYLAALQILNQTANGGRAALTSINPPIQQSNVFHNAGKVLGDANPILASDGYSAHDWHIVDADRKGHLTADSLEAALRDSMPVLLQKNLPSGRYHIVVAKGLQPTWPHGPGPVGTYKIMDPLGSSTTLYKTYGNVVNLATRARLDSLPGGQHLRKDAIATEAALSSGSGLILAIDAGQHLMLTDPTGNTLDLSTDSTWTTTIPDVVIRPLLTRGHWDDDPQFAAPHTQIVLPNAASGDYSVLLTGPQTANIALTAQQYDPSGISTAAASAAVSPTTIARYRLQHNASGGVSLSWLGTTDVDPVVPGQSMSLSVYPNPMISAGHIRLTLDRARYVSVEMYDIAGRRVATVAKGHMEAGDHVVTWPTVGSGAPGPGLYLVRVTGPGVNITRRVVVLRGR
jgi:hypothetical protein